LIQLQLVYEIEFRQRLPGGRQNRHGHQIDRRHRGSRVDFGIDPNGEI